MAALEEVFRETMPSEMGFDYFGMSFQEKVASQGVPSSVVFGLSLLAVFLILAAQYESWSLPFSVLLGTPIAVFGAFAALWLRGLDNDVFAQIGLVMLIGLAAKNAILIVEFAKDEYEKGKSVVDAALSAARLRLRPILMTAFAFILGVVPLVTAEGAGAVSRRILGTGVMGGMLAATFIAIFIIPVSFYVVERCAAGGASPRANRRRSPSPPRPRADAGRRASSGSLILRGPGHTVLGRMTWWVWVLVGLGLLGIEVLTPGGFFVLFFGLAALVVGALAGSGCTGRPGSSGCSSRCSSVGSLLLFRRRLARVAARVEATSP